MLTEGSDKELLRTCDITGKGGNKSGRRVEFEVLCEGEQEGIKSFWAEFAIFWLLWTPSLCLWQSILRWATKVKTDNCLDPSHIRQGSFCVGQMRSSDIHWPFKKWWQVRLVSESEQWLEQLLLNSDHIHLTFNVTAAGCGGLELLQ